MKRTTQVIASMCFAALASQANANGSRGNPAPTPTPAPSVAVTVPVNATGYGGTAKVEDVKATATASPVIAPVISPTITGGNSAATGGTANLTGTVTGTNTLNGTVSGQQTTTVKQGDISVGPVTGGKAVIEEGAVKNTLTANPVANGGKAVIESGAVKNNLTANPVAKIEKGAVDVDAKAAAAQDQQQRQQMQQEQEATARQRQSNQLSEVGKSTVDIKIDAPKPVAPAPTLPVVIPQAPQIIPTDGMPANAKNARFITAVSYQCPTVLEEYDIDEVRKETVSGTGTALWVPHNNYKKYAKAGLRPRVAVASVPEQLETDNGKCLCLGILQVEANANDATKTNLARVQLDAAKFVRSLEGYGAIYMIAIDTASVNKGVNADAKGLGAGTGGSGIFGLITGMLGLSANVSNGRTFVEAQVGETYALVAGGVVPEGAIALDPAKLRDSLK